MKQIELTQGKFTIVDDEDFEELNKYKWFFHHNGYAVRSEKRKTILMHRVLLKAEKGVQIDHINHNKLDNQKENLRLVTQQENFWNTPIRKTNTTGYKGVSIEKRTGKFIAQIVFNGKQKYLGSFSEKEKAALAYNEAAKSLRKGITFLNSV